ncbi:MAG: hypothetical protein HY927_14575 [Elusimicrobia bacterium]|nr:hypothetical protein [Elusimicrobiota bacterium]
MTPRVSIRGYAAAAAFAAACAGPSLAAQFALRPSPMPLAGGIRTVPYSAGGLAAMAGAVSPTHAPWAALPAPAPVPGLSPGPLDLPAAPPTVLTLAPQASMKVAAMDAGIRAIAAAVAQPDKISSADASEAGQQAEDLLTGRSRSLASPADDGSPVPAGPDAGPSRAATPQDLGFAARASAELASLADDAAAERGLKAGAMTGQDFLDILLEGRARYALQRQARAPSPAAFAAAQAVQAGTLRMARALLDPKAPLSGQIRRLLSVWQVFNQAMEEAAEKGTLEAVEAEASLFASQVERSV